MNNNTFKRICKEKKLNYETVIYNCGFKVEELRYYKGEIFKPFMYCGGKPKYQYLAQYEIKLEDYI